MSETATDPPNSKPPVEASGDHEYVSFENVDVELELFQSTDEFEIRIEYGDAEAFAVYAPCDPIIEQLHEHGIAGEPTDE